MIITNNVPAMQAATNLGKTNKALAKSMNNLSIGTKINSAKDDAAGMAITNKLKNQVSGLHIASQNAMDGVSLIQTAEGALSEITAMLQRMREMSVQAANDTNTPADRELIAVEYEQLRQEITQVSARTEFNKIKILSGELYKYQPGDENKLGVPEYAARDIAGTIRGEAIAAVNPTDPNNMTPAEQAAYDAWMANNAANRTTELSAEYLQQFQNQLTLQVGPNMAMEFDFSIPKITASTLNLVPWPAIIDSATGLRVSPPLPLEPGTPDYEREFGYQRAVDNLAVVDTAVMRVSELRAHLGAASNRLEHTTLSLDTTALNTERARSRIEDTDMAFETTVYSSKNVIMQSAIAIIAQANQRPQSILQLM